MVGSVSFSPTFAQPWHATGSPGVPVRSVGFSPMATTVAPVQTGLGTDAQLMPGYSPIQDPKMLPSGSYVALNDPWGALSTATNRRPVRWVAPRPTIRPPQNLQHRFPVQAPMGWPTMPGQQQPFYTGPWGPGGYTRQPDTKHLQHTATHQSPQTAQQTPSQTVAKAAPGASQNRPTLPASKSIDPVGSQNTHMLLEIPPEHQAPQTEQERLEFILQRMRDQSQDKVPETLEEIEEITKSWM